MDINALRGGVAPKSRAPVRALFFILEAPCFVGCPRPHFYGPAYGAGGSRKLCNLRVRNSYLGKARIAMLCKAMCPRAPNSCPANAEQGMTCSPANDATGQSSLPCKNGRVHDLVTCQPSTSGPLKYHALPSTSDLGKACTLPSTSIPWSIALRSTLNL